MIAAKQPAVEEFEDEEELQDEEELKPSQELAAEAPLAAEDFDSEVEAELEPAEVGEFAKGE